MSRQGEEPIEWLTRSEAAAAAKVSPSTIDRWARKGALIRRLTPGGAPRYRRRDIDDALQATQRKDA